LPGRGLGAAEVADPVERPGQAEPIHEHLGIRSSGPAALRYRRARERRRLVIPAEFVQDPAKIVLDARRLAAALAGAALHDRERLAVERLGFRSPAGLRVRARQIVESIGERRMVVAEHLATDRD